ncbi:MAG: ATP-binding protein [Myxococcales bacterium]|nr:ATP-binding protein [Myxococcales bacterium]
MASVAPSTSDQLDEIAAIARGWLEALLRRTARAPDAVEGVPRSRFAVAASDVVRILDGARTGAGGADDVDPRWAALGARPGRLATLASGLGLTDLELRIVAAMIAPEHDPDLERAYAFAWDDFTRKRPDVGFLIELVGGDDAARRGAVRSALAPEGALRRLRVVLVGVAADTDVTPPARRPARLADRVIGFLQGDDGLDPALDGVVALAPPATVADVVAAPAVVAVVRRALTQAGAAPPRVLVHGSAGIGKTLLVRALATEAGRSVVRVDVAELVRAPDRLDERMARIAREAGLRGAITLFHEVGVFAEVAPGLTERFADLVRRTPGPVVLTAHVRPPWLTPAVPELVEVAVPGPTLHERIELWQRGLAGVGGGDLVDPGEVRAIAARFALGGGAIRRAAERAVSQARLRGDARIDLAALGESARLMLQHRLGTVARRIEPGFVWDDLVLPDDTHDTIRELCNFAKYRAALLEEWGWARKLPYGRGVSAIMAGPPGTGKTMVAQLLARELGYDLYLIELAQVVNKYVGETEKNLARVFDEAENSHAILFFDEADALFAKRTEVKSSNDRYANLEVNYLLQRMETYNGVTLLATNLEQGIDDAFKRRVRFTIQFEMPEPPVRTALWKSMFPPESKVAEDIDWERLGARFEMSGGYIKKAALRAAARAMDRGSDATITGADLELAAGLEYREMGRIG